MGSCLHCPPRWTEEDFHGEEAPPGARSEELRAQGAAVVGGKVAPGAAQEEEEGAEAWTACQEEKAPLQEVNLHIWNGVSLDLDHGWCDPHQFWN